MTALIWRRSSFSDPNNCVEVAWPAEHTAVRDSKSPSTALSFERAYFVEFLGGLSTQNSLSSGSASTTHDTSSP